MPLLRFIPQNNTIQKDTISLAEIAARQKKGKDSVLSNVIKSFKVSSLSVENERTHISGFLTSRSDFECAPYDFDRINRAVDTDSYAQQSFSKFKELMWKEGWDIVGKNDDAVAYLWKRINLMEVAMKRSFYDLLVEVADQLVKFNNVFIAKSRGNLAPFFPGKLTTSNGKKPLVGYYVLPTEKIEVLRDKHNNPIRYRQRIDESGASDVNAPEWPAEDVIHLVRNRKPGRIFGTPFVIAALDDIVSLRQLEEDLLNLFHRELFPLYFYTVGNDTFPADKTDIDQAENQLAMLRTEGGIIAPHTHALEVLGAENKALNVTSELQHFKERVAVGLGVYPHHLGMGGGSANKDMTDRLDIALYDKVKEYQKYMSEELRRTVFNELLIEGGFDPFGLDSMEESEDRCMFQFNEIDVDTQIKKETHSLNKLDRNVSTVKETRREVGKDNDIEEDDTSEAMKQRIMTQYMKEQNDHQTDNAIRQAKAVPKTTSGSGSAPAQKPAGSGSTSKAVPRSPANSRSTKKGSGNVIRPSNQHGTRTSPNIRHSGKIDFHDEVDMEWLDSVESLLQDDELE